ncbi:MAG: DNA topoisomerase I [Deltaproteobacteria bacterium DG_8]|nr:MAG: DNA topoisomerase I [Deltaproteobacteria bacterium DG_8]
MSILSSAIIVVESPTKAKTLSQFLGKKCQVLACLGHVRALPSKPGSVDIKHDFEPRYQILSHSRKYLSKIEKSLRRCEKLYLATDMDREGEAIAWHLTVALNLANGSSRQSRKGKPLQVRRIVFHEITKEAIEEALKYPRNISPSLVDAQQARVVLDYLYGFNLSPFLWKKVRPGLSAGRVQSVALRLICEREKEIQTFKAQEYWSIKANLSSSPECFPDTLFSAELVEIDGMKLDKFHIKDQASANGIIEKLEGAEYRVKEIRRKEIKRNPAPPFTTSTLQQEASRKLKFSAKKTMSIAQKLYEGVVIEDAMAGLITYMRTDSVNLAESALFDIKEKIVELFGRNFSLKSPRRFKQKSKNVQEAHEAIRPTDISLTPEEIRSCLTPDQFKLYDLIWKRTLASQMAPALLDSVSVDIVAKDSYLFKATGSTIKFPGFMKVYIEGKDDESDEKKGILPQLVDGQVLALIALVPEQHFTQPPPRYTEATLVKTLEEYGIGRPSTYATIIDILRTREYVKTIDRRFFPEDLGLTVSELLVNHFPRYVDYQFTAQMEEELDEIARGEISWKPVVRNFWKPFINLIDRKDSELKKSDIISEETEEVCPQCGGHLIIKLGRYGRFYGCEGYPKCKYVRPLDNKAEGVSDQGDTVEERCEKCGKPMIIKESRYGKFLACSGYPQCRNVRSLNKSMPLGIRCPECKEGEIVGKRTRRGKLFYGCSNYPQCSFASWDKPVDESCPHCGSSILIEKESKRYGVILRCIKKGCHYKKRLTDG